MTTHDLKIWPPFFQDLTAGVKTAEVRRNDRDFREGDSLLLREWDPLTGDYTRRFEMRTVRKVYDLYRFGCPGFVLMELQP